MMGTYLTQMTKYLQTQSWQIAALVAIIALVTWALRNKSAHVRYLLWLIVLAKCLVPPLVSVPVAVLPQKAPAARSVPRLPMPMPAETVPVVHKPMTEPGRLPPERLPSIDRTSPAPGQPAVVERGARLTPRQWLGVAWIAGATLFVLAVVIKALRTNFWLHRKRSLLPAESQAWMQNFFHRLGIKTSPKVWLVDGIGQPFVWGLLRGGIYLPADFVKTESTEHRRGVLSHELSHVLRFDAGVNVLQVIAQATFWFHPFVWWANKKIRAEREKCCDEMAIARLDALPKDYSSAIVDTLASEHESTRPVPSLAVVGPLKNIEERIRTIMKPGKRFYKRPSLVAAAFVSLLALLTVPSALVLTARAQRKTATQDVEKANALGKLEYIDHLKDEVRTVSVTSVEISPDGRHAYTAAPMSGAPTVFKRNDKTGYLEPIQAISQNEDKDMRGAIAARVSPDGRYVVCTTIRTNTVRLYERDMSAGTLKELNVVKDGKDGMENLNHAVDATFSPDSRFVYVIAARSAALSVFRITDDKKLGFVQCTKGENNCFDEARGIAISPDGKYVYVASSKAGTLVVLKRDTDTGRTELKQVVKDEEGNVHGLAGVFGVTCSPDGRFIYTNGGLFEGDNAVCAFKRMSGGRLSLVQEIRGGEGSPIGLVGGNELQVSRDGRNLYALGNESNSVVVFRRNVETGKLTHIQTFYSRGVAHYCLPAGIGISSDDEYVYVAGEGSDVNGILFFKRLTGGKTGPAELLYKSACSGDVGQVKSLIAGGSDINQKAERGYSALHWAAKENRKDAAELLIDAGADVNARTGLGGWTPLHIAVREGNKDVAELLISKGADLEAANRNNGQTPFRITLEKRDADFADFLIDHGISVDAKSDWGGTALHQACMVGATSFAKFLIEKGANVNQKTEHNVTPLHCATRWPQTKDIVELLLSKGADANVKDSQSWTPLHLAARAGAKDVVELLVAKGADANAKNTHGWAPLHYAVTGGATSGEDVIKVLAANGADVDIELDGGWTALHLACDNGNAKALEALLANGADANLKTDDGKTPLAMAKEKDQQEIVELLHKHAAETEAGREGQPSKSLHEAAAAGDLDQVKSLISKGAEVNARNTWDRTPLHDAAMYGRADIAELLIAQGINVEAKDQLGFTPLFDAATCGHKGVAELLIAKGADVNAKTNRGWTPLHWAALKGHKDIVELLIAKGANVNSKEKDGETAADFAIQGSGRFATEIVKLMMDKGADISTLQAIHLAAFLGDLSKIKSHIRDGRDVNAKNKHGYTLVHAAAMGGQKELLEFLIAEGADVDGKDRDSKTAVVHAAQHGHMDIAELLIAKGADINTKGQYGHAPLHAAALGGHSDMAGLLIGKGADVNIRDDRGWTPLYSAISSRDKDTVELLVHKGADLNMGANDGWTPLHWAAAKGDKGAAALFIAKGAEIRARDNDGATPLYLAAWYGYRNVAELLLDKGADVNAKAEDRCTPLHVATYRGHRQVAKLLISRGADLNAENNKGSTPLHYAASQGDKDLVGLLLAKGANVNAKDTHGQAALDIAKDKGYTEIVELLQKHGAKG